MRSPATPQQRPPKRPQQYMQPMNLSSSSLNPNGGKSPYAYVPPFDDLRSSGYYDVEAYKTKSYTNMYGTAPSYPYTHDDEEIEELKDDEEMDHQATSSSVTAYNGKYQYKKLFAAIKDLQKHGVKVSAPEFVFIGFQSSGKTSAVSQAAKMPIGIIQDGTGSRCPTRFRLICNKKAKGQSIWVNGRKCQNEAEMIQLCCDIHKRLDDEKKFSRDVIEVRIESADVPELTFVDLPGMFQGDSDEILDAKRQIDEMTAWFLHDPNPDGTYKYIPILVMEPVEREHKTKNANPVNYVDALVQRYEAPNNGNKRTDWANDALFIVNKFDKVTNVGKASDLLDRIRECCGNGQYENNTILTMMNAKGHNTAAMNNDQLKQFVMRAPKDEEDKWGHIMFTFKKKDDPSLEALREKKEKLVGIARMNETLEERMCNIAKKCLPSLQTQMELAEKEKEEAINSITKQLLMCDPLKLKTECIEFGNLFMKHLTELYNGSFIAWMHPNFKKTWIEEVSDFQHNLGLTNTKMKWQYAITPTTLEKLVSEVRHKPKPKQLLRMLQMHLMGTAALRRILDAWKCQVQYMSFPDYTDEDIVNISGGFNETIQPSVWESIRNVVLASIHHLSDAVQYLGEMFRYKLKENADIIFEWALQNKFGKEETENSALIRLLQRTLRDYKKEIDNLIDEFIASIEVEQRIAQVLDQQHCEDTILIGRYVGDHLKYRRDPSVLNKYSESSKSPRNSKPRGKDASKLYPEIPDSEEPKMLIADGLHEGDGDDIKDKDKEALNKDSHGRPLMGDADKDRFDRHFYSAMNIQEVSPKMTLDATIYDIDTIKRYSFVFWTILKQTMIREIIQKVANHVMAYVTQHDRLANAVHVGVDRRNIQDLLNQLVEKTGVDNTLLEAFVKKNRTRHIEQSINDLNEDDLKQVYGIDVERLRQVRQRKIAELEQYKRLKARTMQKIYLIKNGNFDAIPDDEEEEDAVINEMAPKQEEHVENNQQQPPRARNEANEEEEEDGVDIHA